MGLSFQYQQFPEVGNTRLQIWFLVKRSFKSCKLMTKKYYKVLSFLFILESSSRLILDFNCYSGNCIVQSRYIREAIIVIVLADSCTLCFSWLYHSIRRNLERGPPQVVSMLFLISVKQFYMHLHCSKSNDSRVVGATSGYSFENS